MNYRALSWIIASSYLLLVEAVALVRGDPLLTDAMRAGADRWLILSAAWGTLGGHFFGESSLAPSWAWCILPLGLLVLARDLLIGTPVSPINHLSVMLLFVGLGALLWGSR